MVDFLKDLNESQRNAVVNTEGPSLIIAGAGSGKTRTLTYRIAYLLQQGVRSSSVLALTFTNKAAAEMMDRIATLVGADKARQIWMGTFHSVFARILRQEASLLGYTSRYTIYDTLDSKSLIASIIKEMKLDTQLYKASEILTRISSAKNNLISWQAYLADARFKAMDEASKRPMIGEIYATYVRRCRKADAMDFDDLLLNTYILLRDFPDVLSRYQQKFNYLLVDEYQDTNYVQYLIVNKLAERHRNLCVVGDDAQSIYSFRGARIENILHFRTDYPDHKIFKLEQNYRSTQTIVNAANSIIKKNKNQIQKVVFSNNEPGEKIKVIESLSDYEEAFSIVQSIQSVLKSTNASYSDFVILYRTNAQSRIFEESLRRAGIPYKIYGNLSFYQRKEIKDVLAYFKLVVNPHDDEALKRVINYPSRGIGDTTLSKIATLAHQHDVSFWKVLTGTDPLALGVNKGTWNKIMSFIDLIRHFSDVLFSVNAYEMAMQIVQATGILNDLKEGNQAENISRLENVEELLNSIRDAVETFDEEEKEEEEGEQIFTLDRYLEKVSLLTDQDEKEEEKDKDRVTLMTVHSSKGLEYNYVYIAGLEEKLFPSQMSFSALQDLEEERRLFYVALTRARKKVVLSYALSRYRWGMPEDCKPSRFIAEIDPLFLDLSQVQQARYLFSPSAATAGGRAGSESFRSVSQRSPVAGRATVSPSVNHHKIKDPSFVPDDPRLLRVGQTVEHQLFGRGVILSMEGPMPDTKAIVQFETGEEKKLLLKFARLKILSALKE